MILPILFTLSLSPSAGWQTSHWLVKPSFFRTITWYRNSLLYSRNVILHFTLFQTLLFWHHPFVATPLNDPALLSLPRRTSFHFKPFTCHVDRDNDIGRITAMTFIYLFMFYFA